MKRAAVIISVSYLAYLLEFIMFNFWGQWGKPELLILVVIFFNLYLGIRFSIMAAVFCGLLKDASGIAPLGTYVLIYVAAAYLTTLIRKYLYQPGSRFSRIVVVFLVVAGCFLLQAVLLNMNRDIRMGELLANVLAPQLLTTVIVATYVFAQLKNLSVLFTLKK